MSSALPSPALSPHPPPRSQCPSAPAAGSPSQRPPVHACRRVPAGRGGGVLSISQTPSRRDVERVGRPGALPEQPTSRAPNAGWPSCEHWGPGPRVMTFGSSWALGTSPSRHVVGATGMHAFSPTPFLDPHSGQGSSCPLVAGAGPTTVPSPTPGLRAPVPGARELGDLPAPGPTLRGHPQSSQLPARELPREGRRLSPP